MSRQQKIKHHLKDVVQDDDDLMWITSQIVHDTKHGDNIDDILASLDINRLGWNHPMFDLYRQQEKEYDETMRMPMDVAEGVVQCLKCSSFKVYCIPFQIRSADEATSTLAQCTQCRTQWIQNN